VALAIKTSAEATIHLIDFISESILNQGYDICHLLTNVDPIAMSTHISNGPTKDTKPRFSITSADNF
jgi:ADP-glucose pyrophosphorylase